jgi:hypothetical protein
MFHQSTGVLVINLIASCAWSVCSSPKTNSASGRTFLRNIIFIKSAMVLLAKGRKRKEEKGKEENHVRFYKYFIVEQTTNEEKRATDRIVSESVSTHWSSAFALLYAFIGSNN